MYRIKYDDDDANSFYDNHKEAIIKAFEQLKNGFILLNVKSKRYVFSQKSCCYAEAFFGKYSCEDNLKRLIIGKPDELLTIIEEFKNNYGGIPPSCQPDLKDKELNENEIEIFDRLKKGSKSNNKTISFLLYDENDNTKIDSILDEKGIDDFSRIIHYIFIDCLYENQDIFDKSEFVKNKKCI